MLPVDLLYLSGFALLFAHELDAIRRREWRFFAQPFDVGDETAYRLFAAIHMPLFALLVFYWDAPAWQFGVDIFLIVHAVAHWTLRAHPLLDFDNWFSRIWIYGAGLAGVAHLAM